MSSITRSNTFRYWFNQGLSAKLTGAPQSIMTYCFSFDTSLKWTKILSGTSIVSTSHIFTSNGVFWTYLLKPLMNLCFSTQLLHLQAWHSSCWSWDLSLDCCLSWDFDEFFFLSPDFDLEFQRDLCVPTLTDDEWDRAINADNGTLLINLIKETMCPSYTIQSIGIAGRCVPDFGLIQDSAENSNMTDANDNPISKWGFLKWLNVYLFISSSLSVRENFNVIQIF